MVNEPKTLPASMRPKKRYMIFEVISETPVLYKDVNLAMWGSFLSLLGQSGCADAKILVLENMYDQAAQRGVVRCRSSHVEQVRAALALVSMIGESRSIVKVLGVTGTIASASSKYDAGAQV
ncbi:MAG: ribonuclease P protein component 2 [Candidatus Aenigmarchaeota archaeon]|nr:ribonuclease P protein component 2 [Candidatus Aenigmarchaeota archaeon]